MDARTRKRKIEYLAEMQICARDGARKAGNKGDDASFDALTLLVCAIDDRIEYVENCDG